MYFSEYIKELRKEMGMTQAEFAEPMELSLPALKNIEQHKVGNLTINIINKLSFLSNKKPIDIANAILFGEFNDENDGDVVRGYLSYMYLEGWNIEDYPYTPADYKYDNKFLQGKIVKKREPKNIVMVTSYNEFILNDTDNPIDVLKNVIVSYMMLYEQYRAVHIVFDEVDNREDFEIIKNIKLNKLGMDFRIILFSKEEGKVKEITKMNL